MLPKAVIRSIKKKAPIPSSIKEQLSFVEYIHHRN